VPNPYNPQHYNRYKDRNAENCPVLLNGAGIPAGAVQPLNSGTTVTWIATAPVTGAAPPGSPWVAQIGPMTGWNANARYVKGNIVVVFPNTIYIATASNSGADPADGGPWTQLTNGISGGGSYSNTTSYTLGSSVLFPTTATAAAGNRFVQKYGESDFTKLLIPLTF
jgi:hypothetical protein